MALFKKVIKVQNDWLDIEQGILQQEFTKDLYAFGVKYFRKVSITNSIITDANSDNRNAIIDPKEHIVVKPKKKKGVGFDLNNIDKSEH